MSSLTELREKVERAQGPDRDIDVAMAVILDGLSCEPSDPLRRWRDAAGNARTLLGALPEYTASIDAALALVERKLPGAEYDITTLYGVAHVDLPLNYSDHSSECGRRADGNVPLAILTALLRALESQEQAGG